MSEQTGDMREALLDAALSHVAFDGWSEATMSAAARDVGMSTAEARALFPRGGVDLALAFHRRGDAAMLARIEAERGALAEMKFREKVAAAVRFRIEAVSDKEAVRRGTALFALPIHAAEGAKAIWGTADAIWRALGDTSEDVNWYSKRATLSAVYGSTVLYWLGDDSLDNQATWEFLDRRIGDVMSIEKAKATVRGNPVLRGLFAGPTWALSKLRAPGAAARGDLPGRWPPAG